MRAVDVIRKKRDGEALAREEIEAFVRGACTGEWPDYQVAALLMAIVLRGMTAEETACLTAAMVASGDRLDWSDIPGKKVDKHSTGGVGDKTSLVLVPLAAACGAMVPKMSGRGLGHTGGTLDKLESIPGYRTVLSLEEFRDVVRTVGCAIVGQTARMVPADKVLYALRDITATVESIPLISASIMSKKLAEGLDGMVLDVKCGSGAFMKTASQARELARSLVSIGLAHGVQTEAVITDMDQPLGQAVGNALEVVECIETLKGKGPADLERLAVELAARLVGLAGLAVDRQAARDRVRAALASGRALEQLQRMIAAQGGNPRVADDYSLLPGWTAARRVTARRTGFVTGMDAERIGRAAMLLGAGRSRIEDRIDHGVGMVVMVKVGTNVREGDPLIELRFNDEAQVRRALAMCREAVQIGDAPPEARDPILLE